MNKHLILILLGFGLISCATTISPAIGKVLIDNSIIEDKNYEIGEVNNVFVGQPIVKLKNYRVKTYESDRMKPNKDFNIEGPLLYGNNSGKKDDTFYVRGTTRLDGQIFTVIDMPKNSPAQHLKLLINEDGVPYKKILNGSIPLIYTYYFKPPLLKFLKVEENEIDISSGYLNYELIYSGMDDENIYVTYREFTPKDFARASFFQELTYSKSSKRIRFKNTLIEVRKATNESIEFIVIEDNQ